MSEKTTPMLTAWAPSESITLPKFTREEREKIPNPRHGMLVSQTDGLSGTYVYYRNAWMRLREQDMIHIEGQFQTDKEIGGLIDITAHSQSTIKEIFKRERSNWKNIISMTDRINDLEKLFTVHDHKFEVVITVCLIVLKAVKAIDLNWLWVFSPMIGGVLFTLAIAAIVKYSKNNTGPGSGASLT